MEQRTLINRFLSGIIIYRLKNKCIHIKPAKVEDKAFADFYAEQAYEDALLEGLLKKEDLEKLIIEKGWWDKEKDDEIKTISNNLEQMKVDYYNNFFREESKKYIAENIEKQNKNLLKLHEQKNSLFDKSCEYLKSFARDSYLIEKTSFVESSSAVDFFKIHTLVYSFYGNIVGDKVVREVAKSAVWRSIWNAAKGIKLFNNDICELTQEQISLVGWSKFYDNVNESLERPDEEVIEDDIALDGWCIVESRKRKEEEKKKKGEGMVSETMQDAGEVFIPVKNAKEQEQVLALNDQYGKSVIRSKAMQFKQSGGSREEDLKHVKKELQMQGLKQAKENRR